MRHFVLIMMVCFLAGCGQKGPLYLPETDPAAAPEESDKKKGK